MWEPAWYSDVHAEAIAENTVLLREFKEAGMTTILTVDRCVTERRNRHLLAVPRDLTTFGKHISNTMRERVGLVDYLEIMNEPNGWSGRGRSDEKYELMTPDSYVRVLRAAHHAAKTVAPNVKVAGPCAIQIPAPWIERVLQPDARDCLDAVTYHAYGTGADINYAQRLKTVRRLMDAAGKSELPMIQTEHGCASECLTADWEITRRQRRAAEDIVKRHVVGLACGQRAHMLFLGDMRPQGCHYVVFLQGNPGNRDRLIPAPVLLTQRACVERLGGARFEKELNLGAAFQCHLFSKPNGDQIIAFWTREKPADPTACMVLGAANLLGLKLYDVMGNERELTLQNGYPCVPLSPTPQFLSSAGEPAALERALLNASIRGVGNPVQSVVTIKSPRQIEVKVLNRTNKPVSGNVRVANAKNAAVTPETYGFSNLPPGGSTASILELSKRIGMEHPISFQVLAVPDGFDQWDTRDVTLRANLVPHARIKVDGNLADWAGCRPIALGAANRVRLRGHTAVPWPDKDTFEAKVCLAWDDQHLYVALSVQDAVFHTDTTKPDQPWLQDSVQLAFDTLRNGGKHGYTDDDFEYSIIQTAAGAQVHALVVSSERYDAYMHKKLGLVPSLPVAIVRSPNKTIYEFAFSPVWVSPFRLEAGNIMRWSLIVNNNDGNGRTGWLEITPGIGKSKQPGKFLDMVLIR
jgi:hypothetical protein